MDFISNGDLSSLVNQYWFIAPVTAAITLWVREHIHMSGSMNDIVLPSVAFVVCASCVYAPVLIPEPHLTYLATIFSLFFATTGIVKGMKKIVGNKE